MSSRVYRPTEQIALGNRTALLVQEGKLLPCLDTLGHRFVSGGGDRHGRSARSARQCRCKFLDHASGRMLRACAQVHDANQPRSAHIPRDCNGLLGGCRPIAKLSWRSNDHRAFRRPGKSDILAFRKSLAVLVLDQNLECFAIPVDKIGAAVPGENTFHDTPV